MLNRTWRIILMVIALIYTVWPDLFIGIRWIALIAVVILLIGELTCKSCGTGKSVPVVKKSSRKRRR